MFVFNFTMAQDACDMDVNTIQLQEDGAVWYNVDTPIGGFQFNVDGGASVTGGAGGDAAGAGFVVQGAGTTVLGFSFTGSSIAAGCGTLTELTLSGDATGLSGIVFSDTSGSAFDVTYYEGSDDGGDGGYEITDGCDLPENNLYLLDGAVLYNSLSNDIGGFQFNVDGATATGASGGDAQAAGFVVQAAGSTVLGFSFTGSSVPAGCGTLTQLTLDGDATGLSGIVISSTAGAALDFSYYTGEDECASGIFDCAGVCDGTAVEDCSGVCEGTAVEMIVLVYVMVLLL